MAEGTGRGERKGKGNFSHSVRVMVAAGSWVLGVFLGLCWFNLGLIGVGMVDPNWVVWQG